MPGMSDDSQRKFSLTCPITHAVRCPWALSIYQTRQFVLSSFLPCDQSLLSYLPLFIAPTPSSTVDDKNVCDAHATSYTLHSRLKNPRPSPCTQLIAPVTPHVTAYTPHPSSHTRHSTFYSLHPSPVTWEQPIDEASPIDRQEHLYRTNLDFEPLSSSIDRWEILWRIFEDEYVILRVTIECNRAKALITSECHWFLWNIIQKEHHL